MYKTELLDAKSIFIKIIYLNINLKICLKMKIKIV